MMRGRQDETGKSAAASGGSTPRQPLLVIVEDDSSVQRLLERTLQRSGYEVAVASTIADARRISEGRDWDLMVLDRRLPDGDGLELCRELKQGRSGLGRYILLLTGESASEEKVESLDLGADDYVTKPFQLDELLARIRAGLRIVELQRALLDANRRLHMLSTTDALTGARNRRFLENEIERAFAHAVRYQRPFSVVMGDVDFFKKVNDEHGHQAGDDVLRAVGELMRARSRRVDTVARYGGEEFVILLPEIALYDALNFAEKMRVAIEGMSIETAGRSLRVTASFGVASYPHSNVASPSELIAAADRALYRAKEKGRNRVELEKRNDPVRTTPRDAQPHRAQ